jgi:2-polyprenyl-6-methoxyphenol hydroxylase-like FAD-dependent oxidoreductase
MYSIDRHILYEHLLYVATSFKNVSITYDVMVNDINFEEGLINLEKGPKRFDWIFATDGAFSETRQLMVERGGFEVEE